MRSRSSVTVFFLSMLLVLLCLSACGTSGRSYTSASGMQETLETEILPNTSKMFVYRLRWPEDEIPNHIQVASSSRTVRTYEQYGIEVNRHTYKRLQENAAHVVAQKGFCREGFLELDYSVSRYHLWLKGECKEGASVDDSNRFGDKKTLPIRQ